MRLSDIPLEDLRPGDRVRTIRGTSGFIVSINLIKRCIDINFNIGTTKNRIDDTISLKINWCDGIEYLEKT